MSNDLSPAVVPPPEGAELCPALVASRGDGVGQPVGGRCGAEAAIRARAAPARAARRPRQRHRHIKGEKQKKKGNNRCKMKAFLSAFQGLEGRKGVSVRSPAVDSLGCHCAGCKSRLMESRGRGQ